MGVDRVFLRKTSLIITASWSSRYTMRQVASASLMRSSWQRWPDCRHRSRVGHRECLAALESAQRHACLDPGGGGERLDLDLAVQPHSGLSRSLIGWKGMSESTYLQLECRRRGGQTLPSFDLSAGVGGGSIGGRRMGPQCGILVGP